IEDNNYLEIESFIRDGAIIFENVDGRTPLHYAVNNGHIKVANILLANGADATKVTNKGNTLLHTAAFKGHKEIIAALLQRVSHNKIK
ncbi:MAG: ankyrin repeat domain-containing protein, partial [Wolbachia sp.]